MSWLDPPHGQDAHAPCYRVRYVGGPYDGRTKITPHPHPERVLMPAATTYAEGGAWCSPTTTSRAFEVDREGEREQRYAMRATSPRGR